MHDPQQTINKNSRAFDYIKGLCSLLFGSIASSYNAPMTGGFIEKNGSSPTLYCLGIAFILLSPVFFMKADPDWFEEGRKQHASTW